MWRLWRQARPRVSFGVDVPHTPLVWRFLSTLALLGFLLQSLAGWFSAVVPVRPPVQVDLPDPNQGMHICIEQDPLILHRPDPNCDPHMVHRAPPVDPAVAPPGGHPRHGGHRLHRHVEPRPAPRELPPDRMPLAHAAP